MVNHHGYLPCNVWPCGLVLPIYKETSKMDDRLVIFLIVLVCIMLLISCFPSDKRLSHE